MSTQSEHKRAMVLASQAWVARQSGRADEARTLWTQALAIEAPLCDLIPCHPEFEPTRSILHVSAASLARGAGKPDIAQALARDGLRGSPPPRLREHLEALRDGRPFDGDDTEAA